MMETPLYPLEGVVSWNMNTTCNYRCSYCTQRFVDDRGQWAKDLPHFIDAFLSLSGDWEIKLSGGEPFRHPDFIEAIAKLSAGGMRVSVVTNLSSSDEELERFAAATASRPGLLSASLHLEYCEPEAFLAKLLRFQESYKGRVCVTSVATREQLPMRIAPNLKGRPCWAGSRYFIVDHKGDAYRCYPARRYREEFLGNLLDGSLRLGNAATECNYNYCNCTVPQERGMVDGSSRC
jgi:MoaA/NifB/PqqE/SkfB family radical SAM enzyme